jgi:hypothetical protein
MNNGTKKLVHINLVHALDEWDKIQSREVSLAY